MSDLHSMTDWERLKQLLDNQADDGSTMSIDESEFLAHLHWLRTLDVPSTVFAELPAVKLQQFAAEARALPAYEMRRLRWSKRYALAAALLRREP